MVDKLLDSLRIKEGRRKLVGLFASLIAGLISQYLTPEGQWIHVVILYSIFSGFNVTTHFLTLKKNEESKI